MRKHILASLALAMLTACSGTAPDNGEKEGVTTVLPEQKNEVTVMKLTKGDFHHELVSNGKVAAGTFADLCFRTSEVVARVWVKNGTFVRKGQKLAELDLFALNNSLAQTRNALAQARLEMHDVLIGQGYQPDNLDAVPAEVMELARVKSGYDRALAQHEAAQHAVEQATLTAPFDGVVANLFDKQYGMAKSGTPFCRIISTSAMEVDFTVLENELPLIKVGDQVEVYTKMTMGLKAVWISYVIPLAILMILILSLSAIFENELICGLVSVAGVAIYYFGIWLFRDRLSNEFVFYIK